jgi:serine/threonine protein phosphatase PrpC
MLPALAFLGHNAAYLLVGFLCLFWLKGEEDKSEAATLQKHSRVGYHIAALFFFLLFLDNLLRRIEGGGWEGFWLCSGRLEVVVLLGHSVWLHLAVVDGVAVGACAGDSRAYLMTRNGELRILTAEASKNRLGSGRAEAFPLRHTFASGETLLLLSDGTWTPLNPYLLKKTVVSAMGKHFSEVPLAILVVARKSGRADDMTAVVLRITK